MMFSAVYIALNLEMAISAIVYNDPIKHSRRSLTFGLVGALSVL